MQDASINRLIDEVAYSGGALVKGWQDSALELQKRISVDGTDFSHLGFKEPAP
jgi:hypothetical protein